MYTSYETAKSGVGRWSTVLLSSTGPIHVLEDPSEGWYMQVYNLHMLCGKETPARPNRFESSCSSIMETRSTAMHRSLIYGNMITYGYEYEERWDA